MRLIRFENKSGEVCHGTPKTIGMARRVRGHIFGKFNETDEELEIAKLLAPSFHHKFFASD